MLLDIALVDHRASPFVVVAHNINGQRLIDVPGTWVKNARFLIGRIFCGEPLHTSPENAP
jgi:hypothetical protein